MDFPTRINLLSGVRALTLLGAVFHSMGSMLSVDLLGFPFHSS